MMIKTMYTDYAAEARSHSSRAAAFTRRAQRDARLAAEQYASARNWTRYARSLTEHPLPYASGPAEAEETARALTSLGDTLLRASFRDDDRAADYRDLAARYRTLAGAR